MPDIRWAAYDGVADEERSMVFDVDGNILFLPSAEFQQLLIEDARRHALTRFEAGRYTDKQDINDITHHLVGYFSSRLTDALARTASRQFMEFLIWQYDQTGDIDDKYLQSQLSNDARVVWEHYGPWIRRTIKLLAESCMMYPVCDRTDLSLKEFFEMIQEPVALALELVQLSVSSDQTYYIFPNETAFEIVGNGPNYYDLHAPSQVLGAYKNRMSADREERGAIFGDNTFERDIETHSRLLGKPFEDHVGVPYMKAIGILTFIVQKVEPIPGDFPVCFFDEEPFVRLIAHDLGVSETTLRRVIEGFVLHEADIISEGRHRWNPRTEYRALRRGMFELSHADGKGVVWSRKMALECIDKLMEGVAFNQLPKEWRNEQINVALAKISNNCGTWFEGLTQQRLAEFGIIGLTSQKSGIGRNAGRLEIPNTVGEIDFVGYSEREQLLVILECKMIQVGTEPKLWQSELRDFYERKNCYAAKFRRKIKWAMDNADKLSQSLQSTGLYSTPVTPQRFAFAIITFYPSITSHFATDIPCMSLTELVREYGRSGDWPRPAQVLNIISLEC